MVVDESRGWYWRLKSLSDRVKGHDVPVRFSIIEREIGPGFCASTMRVDEDVVAYNIGDANTLLGILFDESLKSKCIADIDENWRTMSAGAVQYWGIDISIVLVQGSGYTNIDAEVLDVLAKVFQK